METIPIGIALLLAFFAGFAYFSRRFMGDLYLERAIVLGPLTGLIMGDIQTGLIIGAQMELIFMGAVDIGGSVPPNLPIGSVLGTAFAISAGLSVEEALAIAIPAALLGSLGELLAKTVSTVFVSGAERYADEGNTAGVSAMVHLGNFAHFSAVAIPAFIGLSLGGAGVKALSESIPDAVSNGLGAVGSVLPALGFGILLSTMATAELLPWFFIGFAIAAYTQFGVLGTAFVGAMAAAVYVMRQGGIQFLGSSESKEDAEGEGLITKSDRRQIFWRSFALQSAFSFDRMQALGFTWTLIPFLKKIYKKKEDLAKALRRHLAFFNTHMWIPGPIFAAVADLEARNAQNPEEFDVSAIQSIKGSLMGPLAGIGDSMFHGTLRPVMAGIAASLALQGVPIAPLVFLAGVNIVHVWVRWVSNEQGFRLGATLFERLDQENLQRLMQGAAIAGLMGVGALVGTWLGITTPLTYTAQGAEVSIQQMLDNIMPKLIPLLTTLGVYWAVRRGVRNDIIMLILAVSAFILGILGIIG